ncbi:MAG: MFS transporter [Anaerolineales bacterium]|nr:MFS transporter [Anaerolineales bacterium]
MYRDLIFVSLSLVTWGIGESAFLYFQPIYLQELGASPLVIGGIFSAVGVAMTIAHIPAGYLADRINRRDMLWTSWMLGLIAGILMATARSLPVFVIGMLIYGFTAFVVSPLNSYITAARGKLSIGRVITLISAMYNLGAIIGPIIGGQIGEKYGIKTIYMFSVVTFACSLVLILQIKPQKISSERSKSLFQIVKNRKFLGFLILVLFSMFAMYLPYPLTSVYLRDIKSISLQSIGLLGSLGSVGNVIISLLLGSVQPILGVLIGQSAAIMFSMFLWKGTNLYLFGFGFFLYGGYRAARGLSTAIVNQFVDESNMGLAYGINETANAIGIILAPLLAGYLYERTPPLMYITSIVLGLIVILLWIIAKRKGEMR